MCEWYLLSSGLGVLFFPFLHSSDEFHKDGFPVLHFLNGLKSRVSAVLYCKFTKRGSVRIKTKQSSGQLVKWSQQQEPPPPKIPLKYQLVLPLHLGVSFASSIILLNSSLACISLFFFSFLSSSARVFTYWSNTWCGQNKKIIKKKKHWRTQTYGTILYANKTVGMRNSNEGDRNKEKRNLFPLFWVEQKVTWVKYNLMKLFVPSRECRHLYTGQDIQLYLQTFPRKTHSYILAKWKQQSVIR